MAKWGEGDPRWIVEERPDATNVNNWHWTEKNAGPWSQDKFKELFSNHTIKHPEYDLKIIEVEKCVGEASANNRKGKLIFFYEWDLHLKWDGSKDDLKYSGLIKIPNISEENDVSEYEIQVSVKNDDVEDADKVKQVMRTDGAKEIRSLLSKYLADLKQEFAKGMILPQKDGVKADCTKVYKSGFNKASANDTQSIVNNKSKSVGTKIKTTSIKQTQKFQCRAIEFYDAMTRIEMVTAFTHGAVKCDAFKNGKFELFGGNIYGEFLELEPGKKIVQKWRYKQWPEGHFSQVVLDIDEKSDHTEVRLHQTEVPETEVDITNNNWNRYYY